MKKIKQRLHGARGKKLEVNYKLSNVHVCRQGFCFQNTFILVKDLHQEVI